MAVSPTTRVFKGKGEKERISVQDGLQKGVHATASLKITYTGGNSYITKGRGRQKARKLVH